MPVTESDIQLETYTDKYGVTLALETWPNVDDLLKTRRFYDDEGVLLLCERLLRRGMTVIDVGANLGQFALFAAARIGMRGVVHAFEPASETYAAFLRNIELDRAGAGRIVANRAAVTDAAGIIEFHEFSREYSVWNSMHAHAMKVFADGKLRTVEPTNVERVPAVTLDDYCDRHGISGIDLLKVDVEGWEVNVMLGGRRMFGERRCRNLIFEISVEPLKGTPYAASDVLQCAADMGFAVGRVTESGDVQPLDPGTFQAPAFANYLAWLP